MSFRSRLSDMRAVGSSFGYGAPMNRLLSVALLALCLIVPAASSVGSAFAGESAQAPGALLIVGGGGTPQVALRRALDVAGDSPRVVVLPFASAREKRGERSVNMWLQAGAAHAEHVDHASRAEAIRAIEAADIIWMPGGSQSSLMEELLRRDLSASLHAAHARGALIGGTSAGAAVMSEVMVARSPKASALISKRTPLGTGLGLFPTAIVDQHFIRRGRNLRLLQTVLDHPHLVGFGIDERTALLVQAEGQIEVLGESQVLIYDARGSAPNVRGSDKRQGARGVALHVLVAGDRFQLE